jgi:YgiT-type zinc finger domain-containing protein
MQKCDICGSEGVNIRRVTRTYVKGEDLLVIENIPIISCPNCGENYLTAETLHEIERIKRNRKNLAVARFVEVAKFDEGNSPVAV